MEEKMNELEKIADKSTKESEKLEELSDLRKLQLSELDILKKFHEVCEKHNLTYYLTGGTLLGAVRHKGFIPWDDDIDVVMPYDDYKKLCKLPSEVFGEEFFLQNADTDVQYPLLFSKLRKNNTHAEEIDFKNLSLHKGHFIDVFSMYHTSTNRWQSFWKKTYTALYNSILLKYDKSYYYGNAKKQH